jgi:hypothetical protein
VIDWLPAHHMFLSVVASRTVNLSFGLRPVNSPVSAHKAPSADSTASPADNCSIDPPKPHLRSVRPSNNDAKVTAGGHICVRTRSRAYCFFRRAGEKFQLLLPVTGPTARADLELAK